MVEETLSEVDEMELKVKDGPEIAALREKFEKSLSPQAKSKNLKGKYANSCYQHRWEGFLYANSATADMNELSSQELDQIILDAARYRSLDPRISALFRHMSNDELSNLVSSADRWNALMRCDRIRVLGSANLGNSGQHIGLELWDNYPPAMVTKEQQEVNRNSLATFVDAIIKYKSK